MDEQTVPLALVKLINNVNKLQGEYEQSTQSFAQNLDKTSAHTELLLDGIKSLTSIDLSDISTAISNLEPVNLTEVVDAIANLDLKSTTNIDTSELTNAIGNLKLNSETHINLDALVTTLKSMEKVDIRGIENRLSKIASRIAEGNDKLDSLISLFQKKKTVTYDVMGRIISIQYEGTSQ